MKCAYTLCKCLPYSIIVEGIPNGSTELDEMMVLT